jgi:hypothetical protein
MLLQAAQLFENLRVVLEDAGMDWGGVCVCVRKTAASSGGGLFPPIVTFLGYEK